MACFLVGEPWATKHLTRFAIGQFEIKGDGIIKQHLGKPDGVRANRQGRLRARIKLFAVDRVHELEGGGAKADLEKISDARDLAREP